MADFDIGSQGSLDVVADGVVLLTATITDFSDKQKTKDLTHIPVNGPPKHRTIPQGWEGEFTLDRLGPELDDFFSRKETNYYAGLPDAEVFLTKTIAEDDGSVSQYRHEGVILKFDDAGKYSGEDKVVQKVSFISSQRPKVA